MGTIKLEKVNDSLYHEPYKDGKVFKWEKDLRHIFITLTDIRVELCLEIERPETSFSLSLRTKDEDSKSSEQGNATKLAEEESDKYSENFGWRIRANGCFEGIEIGLIKEDGTVSDIREHFDNTDVILRPVSDSEKEKAYGYLIYSDAKYERRTAPYLCLDLFVPESRLNVLCNEIVSGRLPDMKLFVHVDVFQSEVDRSLWEPPMRQDFYIEEGGIFGARAYLSWLAASKSVVNRDVGGIRASDDSADNSSDLSEPIATAEKFSETKADSVGKLIWKLLTRLLR